MKSKQALYLSITGLFLLITGQAFPQNVFQKTYGGVAADFSESIRYLSDGGFVLSGTTSSYGTGGAEARELFIGRYNLIGVNAWTAEAGTNNKRQESQFVIPLSDGGFWVGGRAYEAPVGDFSDSWLTKKYSAAGANLHERLFGKTSANAGGGANWDDELLASMETPIANVVAMLGFTTNYGTPNEKEITFCTYNITAGTVGLTRHFGRPSFDGGATDENGRDLCEDSPGQYTILGNTPTSAVQGRDMIAMHLTAVTYNMGTYRTFGGTGSDEAWSITKCTDGGYLLVGYSNSPGSAGGNDWLVIKTDVNFTLTWARMIGGAGNDEAYEAAQTSDGGFIIVGNTSSYGFGGSDMMVVKLTSGGVLSWAKCYGGTGADGGRSISKRPDGGFYFSGACSEPISPAGNGQDIYVVATNSIGYSGGCNEMSVTPTFNNAPVLNQSTVGMTQVAANPQIEFVANPQVLNTTAATMTCKCENFAPNEEITGSTQVCRNSSGQYWINRIPGYTNYSWTITGASFSPAPIATDTLVNVNFTNTNAQIIVSTAASGCNDFVIDTIDITMDLITTAITTPDSLLCIGDNTNLTAVTSNQQGAISSWVWTPSGPNNPVNNVSPGVGSTVYSVTVTDAWGCTAGDQITVQVFNYPVVNIGPNDTVCNGGPVLLDATTAGGSYLWSTTAVTPTINAVTSGTYWVDVTTNGCTTRDSIILGISTGATINITGDDSICEGQSTTLTANPSGGGGGYTYLWSGGLGTANNITQSPPSTTTYTVTVTEAFGCTNTATKTVNVFLYPTVNIGPNDTVCNGGPVLLNATTASATYLWSTSATTATINAVTSGTYWVDVTVNGCATRDSIILGISVPPTITITGDDSICLGQNTILTANPSLGTAPYTYLWASGLGTANNINVSPGVNTTYTVTVTESFGCTNTSTKTVNVFNYPVVNIGPNDTVCNGGPVLLDATTPGGSYVWNTTATTATINAATSGIYWVDVNTNGCVTRDSIILGISTNPTVNITGNDSICQGQNTILTANPGGGTMPYGFLWSGGLGTANNINVSPGSNTTYTVTVTEAFGCTQSTTQLVTVTPYPIVSLGPDTGICNGAVPFVTLDAQNPGFSYLWSTAATSQTVNIATSQIVWVDVTNNGCTTRDSVTVTFSTNPTAGYTGITTICAGTSTMMYGSGSGGTPPLTYTWSQGPTTADSISLSPPVTTPYSVITADVAGCSDTAFFTITVNPLPVVNLGPDTVGCIPTPVTLNAPATTGTILWSTGAATTSISVPAADTVWLDITENGCTTRDSVVVDYYPLPSVNLGPDTTLCSIQNLLLDATNVFASYVWSDATTSPTLTASQSNLYWVDVTSCGITVSDSIMIYMDTFSVYIVSLVPNDCGSSNGSLTVASTSVYPTTYLWSGAGSGTNPALTNIADGTYIITATDSVGCVQTANIPVVCTIPSIVVTQLVTPNGDGKNDTWIIQGINNFPNAVVAVYNRWGNEVYRSVPYNNDWDGRSNSSISLGNDYLPAGTYFYVVDVYGDGSDVESGYLEFQP